MVLFFLFIRCANDKGADQQQNNNNKALVCPRSWIYLVYVDMVGNRGFSCLELMFGWANIHASATCTIAFFVCGSIGSAPHYHTCLTHACLLLITVIVGKQHGGLCFKVLTHQTTLLHFDGKRKT